MARFTDLGVARLKPKKTKTATTEGGGLYLQVSPKGKKTWCHLHRTDKERKWINLGEFPDMSVADARKRNEEAAKFAATTVDLTAQAITFNSTLNDLFAEWHGNAKDKKGNAWSAAYKRNVKYMFEATVLPVLGEKRLRDITKADIRVLLQKKEKQTPGQALEIYRRLSRIFNYAASADYIEISPMVSLEPIGNQKPKDRYLSAEEIKVFLAALPFADMLPKTANALELILRTGQRPGEVCGANKLEMQDGVWVIPGNRTKNGEEQRVPLTQRIKELFGEANQNGLYFPSARNAEKPIDALTLSKALRRSVSGKEKRTGDAVTIPVKPFSPHDLRRSCATGLGGLGVTMEVIGAVLNHKSRTVTGIVYQHYKFDTEKRLALEDWELELLVIMGLASRMREKKAK